MQITSQETKRHKLTEPKILNIFLSSLKSLYKQQEAKKRNYKKFINSFSVRVQKYDDSSSSSTQHNFKLSKAELLILSTHTRKKKTNAISNEYSYNSDSSIYNGRDNNQPLIPKRENHPSLTKTLQNEKMKFLKKNFRKQIDQKSSKKFLLETETFSNFNTNSNKSPNNTKNLNKKGLIGHFTAENIEKNKELIIFDEGDYENDDSNNNCSFSLDQKSKIIYVKESPNNNSSITNSNAVSKQQNKINETPKSPSQVHMEDNSNLDHDSIIEKLKNIEINRNRNQHYSQSSCSN